MKFLDIFTLNKEGLLNLQLWNKEISEIEQNSCSFEAIIFFYG